MGTNAHGQSGALWCLLALAFAVMVGGCTTVPTDYPREPSAALEHPEETRLGRTMAVEARKRPGQSGFVLLARGTDAFAARYALADLAERTLDMQYYIIRDDESTAVLMSRVAAAADRGVRVRLLVDDIYAVGRDFEIAAFAALPNVEVRVFNPFLARGPLGLSRLFEFLGSAHRLNRRMHNKMMVADNTAAVIGGRNLGNEYFHAEAEVAFVDMDVLAVGPVVREASRSFDEYWNSDLAVPIEAFVTTRPSQKDMDELFARNAEKVQALARSDYAQRVRQGDVVERYRRGELEFIWGEAQALWDRPAKISAGRTFERGVHLGPEIADIVKSARNEYLLISPYFVPGNDGVQRFAALRNRGMRVRILTNSLAANDVGAVHTGYARYREPLLREGVELYELRPLRSSASGDAKGGRAPGSSRASLHAKALVLDRSTVLIGSANADPRSALLNTEFTLVIRSPALANELVKIFERLVEPRHSYRLALESGDLAWIGEDAGREVHYTTEPETSVWRRMTTSILSLFAPEALL